MLLSRRVAAYLLGVGAFQWVIWPTFLRNIWKDPRSFSHGDPTGFLL
ncbi:MAG: SCO4848 family membrane protein, partial [Mycobacteriales bacterium]